MRSEAAYRVRSRRGRASRLVTVAHDLRYAGNLLVVVSVLDSRTFTPATLAADGSAATQHGYDPLLAIGVGAVVGAVVGNGFEDTVVNTAASSAAVSAG